MSIIYRYMQLLPRTKGRRAPQCIPRCYQLVTCDLLSVGFQYASEMPSCYLFLVAILVFTVKLCEAIALEDDFCTTWPSVSGLRYWLRTRDARCLRQQLARVLGYGVVAGAALVKLPQLLRILQNRSAAGISVATYLVESFGYAYNLAYHYRAGYPFSTYGDFVLLGVQNCLIMALIFYFNNQWFPLGLLTLSSYITATVVASWSQRAVPLAVLERLCSLNLAIVIGSRLPQILANARRKHTGSLSLATCLGLFGGATARVFTTMQQVQNHTILVGYLASAFLNGILVAQILMYRKQTRTTPEVSGATMQETRARPRKSKTS